MRPASIVGFEGIILLMIVLGALDSYLNWDRSIAEVSSQDFGPAVLIFTLIIGYGLLVLLGWLIARRRSNAAKWVYVVLTVLGYVALAVDPTSLLTLSGPALTLALAQHLLLLASVWLLFRSDARAWFRGLSPGERDEIFR